MKRVKASVAFLIPLGFVLLACPAPALAYIDPGTGSLLVQLLIASILGAIFALKRFWTRLFAVFKNKPNAGKDDSKQRHNDSKRQ